MNKNGANLILALFTMIVIGIITIACQNENVPPAPGQPRITNALLGRATGVFSGYAPAYDVFDSNKMIFFISSDEASVKDGILEQEISVEHEGGYVWGTGYYYDYSKKRWAPYQLEGEHIKGSNWIRGKAAATLEIDEESIIDGRNYIVAYSCKKHDNKWRCGCSTENGPCNQWMLQYYNAIKAPPEPETPGDKPKKEENVELSISSSKKSYIPGEEVMLIPSIAGTKMLSEIITSKGIMTLKNDMNAINQDEFIIQFKEEPLLAKKNILETEIAINENKAKNEPDKVMASALINDINVLKSSVKSNLQQHKTRLASEHIAAKNEVINALSMFDMRATQPDTIKISSIENNIEARIMAEYYNVFNGIAVKMNAAEAEQIKKFVSFINNLLLLELTSD